MKDLKRIFKTFVDKYGFCVLEKLNISLIYKFFKMLLPVLNSKFGSQTKIGDGNSMWRQ